MPSRRVRREMEKLPAGLMKGGGRLFFPGGDRGALHTAIVTVLGLVLMAGAAWFCYSHLEARTEGDKAALIEDYEQAMGDESGATMLSGMSLSPSRVAAASMPETELKAAVAAFHGAESRGFLAFLLVMGVTLLLISQVTWRLTLSGISKSLSGVLAGLLVAVLLIVPYIAQAVGGSETDVEEQKVAQFSPIQAGINAVIWGKQNGRAQIHAGDTAARLQARADAHQWRWITYCTAASAVAGGLLVLNLVSRRKILERIRKLSEGGQAPQPVQATQEQLAQAIAAVTAPEPPLMAPPAGPMESPQGSPQVSPDDLSGPEGNRS